MTLLAHNFVLDFAGIQEQRHFVAGIQAVAVQLERIVDMVEGVRLLEPMSDWSHLMQRLDYSLKKRNIVARIVADY